MSGGHTRCASDNAGRIGEILLQIQAGEGLAVKLAEQNASWALAIAKRAVMRELGRSTAEGAAAALAQDPKIRSAYLGV